MINNNSLGKTNHTAIIVLGLGENRESKTVEYLWKRQGVKVIFFQPNWKSEEKLQDKLKRLSDLIDKEAMGNKVSLVGVSAGGSLVINAFVENKNKVDKVITLCARLRKGEMTGFRGFEERTKGYPAFRDSVILAEKVEKLFDENDRKKIMTVHALLGDELVPQNTTTIEGAKNITVPTGEHVISSAASLTIFSKPLVKFILEK
ncbi:MAG: hypothetical protein WC841_03370 [Candidatus Shapirobacteria bacterium]